MKNILFIIVLLFNMNTSYAGTTPQVCSLGEVQNIAIYQNDGTLVSQRPLTESETSYLKDAFDSAWSCNEGVTLLGAISNQLGENPTSKYEALCSVDSLGTHKVQLELACIEKK